jgi:hypothetical protein
MMQDEIAGVFLRSGQLWLVVAGIPLAMAGEPCHDPTFHGTRWNRDTLTAAADRINAHASRKTPAASTAG